MDISNLRKRWTTCIGIFRCIRTQIVIGTSIIPVRRNFVKFRVWIFKFVDIFRFLLKSVESGRRFMWKLKCICYLSMLLSFVIHTYIHTNTSFSVRCALRLIKEICIWDKLCSFNQRRLKEQLSIKHLSWSTGNVDYRRSSHADCKAASIQYLDCQKNAKLLTCGVV
jgi:hypothetical protein